MGIYIHGVSMPKMPEKMEQGQDVPYVDVRVFADGDAVISTGVRPYYKKYQAIELPPHGRLGDLDKLDYAFTALRFNEDGSLNHWDDRKNWCLHGSEIEMLLASAPTIIPADPEGGADG